jgi:hypothetical protein
MSDEDILSSVYGLQILATRRSQLEKISRLFAQISKPVL